MSLRTFHFRPCPFITRLELKGFQRRTPTFLPAESPLRRCRCRAWVADTEPLPRRLPEHVAGPWHGWRCHRGVTAPRWRLAPGWEGHRGARILRKGQQSIHGFGTVVGVLLALRCPWGAASGAGRGKFSASLPQSCPRGSHPLPRGMVAFPNPHPELHKSCLNGIVSGAACRPLLGVLVPIKIP